MSIPSWYLKTNVRVFIRDWTAKVGVPGRIVPGFRVCELTIIILNKNRFLIHLAIGFVIEVCFYHPVDGTITFQRILNGSTWHLKINSGESQVWIPVLTCSNLISSSLGRVFHKSVTVWSPLPDKSRTLSIGVSSKAPAWMNWSFRHPEIWSSFSFGRFEKALSSIIIKKSRSLM